MKRALLATILLAACGSDDDGATGTITASVYGEEFIEEGIPSEVFADGWAVSFTTFEVNVGKFAAKAGEGSPEVTDPALHTVDLAEATAGAGTELAMIEAPAGLYDHFGYAIEGIHVVGAATNEGITKTFDWTFTTKLGYAHCEMNNQISGNNVDMQATVHADHLFYDSATSEEPEVRFQLIADADMNGDNAITLEELAAKDIRGETLYQTGSLTGPDGLAIENLRQYVTFQQTTVGHINGEGHCEDVIALP